MIHDTHPNWTLLSGWTEAEHVFPEIAAQWDVICAKFLDLADHDVEVWLCTYSRVIDVVPLPLLGGTASIFFRYSEWRGWEAWMNDSDDMRVGWFTPLVTMLGDGHG